MFELIIYFLRKRKIFFYTGLLAFTFSYTFILSLYYFEWSEFQKNLFGSFFIFSLLWYIAFILSFLKNKERLFNERQMEKFGLLKEYIINEFELDTKSSIFERIELISIFIKENFSAKGLLSERILKLTNSSLTLYVENLQLQKQFQMAYDLIDKDDTERKSYYLQQIFKNSNQNKSILNHLDTYIKELMDKKNNDNKMNVIMNEFANSLELLNELHPKG